MFDLAIILNVFRDTSINIVRNLGFTVKAMFYSFIMIDLVLSMLFNKDDGLEIFMTLIKKILLYGFFGWMILHYQKIVMTQILTGFIQLGNVASGMGHSKQVLFSITDMLKKLEPILSGTIFATGGVIAAIDFALVESIPIGIVFTLLGIVFFVVMTILEIVITFIKFYLVAGFAFIFMPFGVFSKTRDIAMKGLHGIFAMGIEIMVLVTIVNLTFRSIPQFGMDKDNLTMGGAMMYFVSSIFFFFLIKRVPSIVSTLLSGSISGLGMTSSGQGVAMGMMATGGSAMKSGIQSMKENYSAYKNATAPKQLDKK